MGAFAQTREQQLVRSDHGLDRVMLRLPRGLQHADREDIAQEAICRALGRPPVVEGAVERQRKYVHAIAMHLVARRRRQPAPVALDELPRAPELLVDVREPRPERAFQDEETRQRVRAVLAELKPEHQRVIQWRCWEGLRIQEMARRAGVSPAAMDSALRRAFVEAAARLRRAFS